MYEVVLRMWDGYKKYWFSQRMFDLNKLSADCLNSSTSWISKKIYCDISVGNMFIEYVQQLVICSMKYVFKHSHSVVPPCRSPAAETFLFIIGWNLSAVFVHNQPSVYIVDSFGQNSQKVPYFLMQCKSVYISSY